MLPVFGLVIQGSEPFDLAPARAPFKGSSPAKISKGPILAGDLFKRMPCQVPCSFSIPLAQQSLARCLLSEANDQTWHGLAVHLFQRRTPALSAEARTRDRTSMAAGVARRGARASSKAAVQRGKTLAPCSKLAPLHLKVELASALPDHRHSCHQCKR